VNGRIVVTRTSLLSQGLKTKLEALELRSETDRVPLRVVETNVGFQEAQFVLSPVRHLHAETRYELWKAVSGSEEQVHGWKSGLAWTTGPATDDAAPRWRSRPTVGENRYVRYGCGPESLVEVNVALHDPSVDPRNDGAVRVRAELRPSDGGRTLRYLLEPFEGVIQIGHGMCSGGFSLEPNRRYVVTLTAVDAAGNEARAPGRPLEIVGPAPKLASKK
jgi:hypothetical protein